MVLMSESGFTRFVQRGRPLYETSDQDNCGSNTRAAKSSRCVLLTSSVTDKGLC